MAKYQKAYAYRFGLKAEEIVADYIQQCGYELLNRRYKTKYGEIDIIAKNSQELLFIEVKGRKILPDLADIASTLKLSRYSHTISSFLSSKPLYQDLSCRMDLIIVVQDRVALHLKDIYTA